MKSTTSLEKSKLNESVLDPKKSSTSRKANNNPLKPAATQNAKAAPVKKSTDLNKKAIITVKSKKEVKEPRGQSIAEPSIASVKRQTSPPSIAKTMYLICFGWGALIVSILALQYLVAQVALNYSAESFDTQISLSVGVIGIVLFILQRIVISNQMARWKWSIELPNFLGGLFFVILFLIHQGTIVTNDWGSLNLFFYDYNLFY